MELPIQIDKEQLEDESRETFSSQRPLQRSYLHASVVTGNGADDALHVAFASVSECAVIISWNFRHILNLKCIS